MKAVRRDDGLLLNMLLDLWDLFCGAPVMVTVIYGVPILLFFAGTASGVSMLFKALGIIDESFRLLSPLNWFVADIDERLGIALVFLALPVYWLFAGIHAGRVFLSGWIKGIWLTMESSQANQSEESVPTGREEACLVIESPQDRNGTPPLDPWLPISIGVNEKDKKREDKDKQKEEWPKEFRFRKIALILSGGGAKGIYQAGAMKAIYEFLKEKKALDCVMSVAGTSIGAWNALFWMAGLLVVLHLALGQV